MANIMSMADIKNRPSRNGFDLSFKKNFTAKVGELLPVAHKVVLPGDKMTIDLKAFTRTQPLNTAAYARMREYYDFFFVPFSQLWNKFGTAITQMNSNVQHASGMTLDDNSPLSGRLPYTTCANVAYYLTHVSNQFSGKYSKNPFGYNRANLTSKLLQYLGYGDFYAYGEGSASWDTPDKQMINNLNLSLFPLLAYQKIYSDFFRYTQWEKTNPSTFNLDFVKGTDDLFIGNFKDTYGESFFKDMNFFDLRYCNYQKDMFHGVLPVAQYGSASVVPVNGGLSVVKTGVPPTFDFDGTASDGLPVMMDKDSGHFFVKASPSRELGIVDWKGSAGTKVPSLSISGDTSFQVSVLALRQAEFLQKWKEVALSGEEDYKSQIQKHWGVSVSEYLSGQCRYLGGIASSLDINEVVNNNITGDNGADIAGKGIFSSNGKIQFESKGEYGIIMCIYHCLPLLDYTGSGVDHSCTLVEATQFPIPELDQIGMESVHLSRIMNPLKDSVDIDGKTFIGYAPRYIDWKTSVDRSVGAFTKSLNTWCLPMGDKEVFAADGVLFPNNPNVEPNSITAGFFKVNPAIANPLFAVAADSSVDTDPLLCSTFFDWKVVRNLDTNGLPY